MLRYNPAFHKLKTFPLYRLWTNHKLQEIVFAKSATFGVTGILLPLVQVISALYKPIAYFVHG